MRDRDQGDVVVPAHPAAAGLGWNEGVTVVVEFPTGVVPAPRPILDER